MSDTGLALLLILGLFVALLVGGGFWYEYEAREQQKITPLYSIQPIPSTDSISEYWRRKNNRSY